MCPAATSTKSHGIFTECLRLKSPSPINFATSSCGDRPAHMAAKVRLKWLLLCAVVGSGCGEPDWPSQLQKEPGAGVAGWYYGGGRSGGSGGTLNGSGGSSAGARNDKTRGGATASGGATHEDPSHAGGEAGEGEEAAGGAVSVAGSKARGGAGGARATGGAAATAGGTRATGGAAATAGGTRTTGGAHAAGGVRSDGGTNNAGANAGDTGNESAGTAGGDNVALSPFFSEYLEGGFLKALEIAAEQAGSLVGCEVHVHSGSGSSLLRNIPLTESATLAEPLLICTAELAAMHTPCQRVENLRFNGNDVVELLCAGQLMDVIGQLGENTVHGWGTADTSTENRNLRRNCGILSGDRNAEDPFEPATEWTGFDITDLSDLGRHCQ